ncbi:MAG: hypothetical protein JNK79_05525 [Chitinophagaceae bacterium]|nr:hypothetical protein [Chitinophagaceae bacterium]
MKILSSDEALINFFSGDKSLTSAKLTRIDIFSKDGFLLIDLYFELLSNDKIKLTFTDVKEYSFYHSSKHAFYYVEILKFFKEQQSIYISLDPVDETEGISEKDNDFILAAGVNGFVLEE